MVPPKKNKGPGVDELGTRACVAVAINTASMSEVSEGEKMQSACEGKVSVPTSTVFFDVNPTPGVVVDKGPRTQMKY